MALGRMFQFAYSLYCAPATRSNPTYSVVGSMSLRNPPLPATDIEQDIARTHTVHEAFGEFAARAIAATVEVTARKGTADLSECAGDQLRAPPRDGSPSLAASAVASTAR